MSSFLFADISLLNEKGEYFPHKYVGVSQSCIDYIGSEDPRIANGVDYDEVFDGRGKLLMPGLYNAHSHVPMTLLRGRGENLALQPWLYDSIFPFEAEIQEEDSYYATLLGIAEMLRFGVVSFSDMYYQSDARAKAVLESGIKANIGHSISHFGEDIPYSELPVCALNKRLIKDYHGKGEGRLLIDFNLHSEYTTTPLVASGLAEAALDAGVRIQVHVSETEQEIADCRARHNQSPVVYLAERGIFDVSCTAAHCTYLDEEDLRILSDKGVFVATCPASNAKLGSGIADIMKMKEHGITICLGTDGVASNNNLNMFKDMYLLALMHRAYYRNPEGMSSNDIITISTRNGALSQGRNDCGEIKVGNKADLVALDIDTPWMTPVDSMSSNVVYSLEGSDVVLTMVDGRVCYRNGEYLTIDIERVMDEVSRSRESILTRLQ